MTTPDLIAEHATRTRLSPWVVAALLKAGLTPPHRDVVDRVGYGAVEIRALKPALTALESL